MTLSASIREQAAKAVDEVMKRVMISPLKVSSESFTGMLVDAVAPVLAEGLLRERVAQAKQLTEAVRVYAGELVVEPEMDAVEVAVSGLATIAGRLAVAERENAALRQERDELDKECEATADAVTRWSQRWADTEAQLAAAREATEKALTSLGNIERLGLVAGSAEFWNAITGAIEALGEGRDG